MTFEFEFQIKKILKDTESVRLINHRKNARARNPGPGPRIQNLGPRTWDPGLKTRDREPRTLS